MSLVRKNDQFHPSKIKLVQELGDVDSNRMLKLSEKMIHGVLGGTHLLVNICFSDECEGKMQLNGLPSHPIYRL